MIPLHCPVWRLLPAGLPPTAPAQAPEGRFHHSGQIAAYASLSAEGALVAITRYLPDGPARVLHRTLIVAAHVADHRGEARASAVWQDIRAGGAPAPTWAFSDAARAAGAQAMLYSSRTRPELTHIVMFDLTCLHHTP